MKALGRCPDYGVELGIELDDGDRVPVSGVPCPAPRVFCPCALVEVPVLAQGRSGLGLVCAALR